LIGLRGNGLHTNGYSLARKVLLEKMRLSLDKPAPGLKIPLGRELMKVHPNYQPLMASLPEGSLNGAAHITGGGLVDNLPRVLPKNCRAAIRTDSWKVPEIFQLIQKGGKIPADEMYQVFNMGIGMVLVVPGKRAPEVLKRTKGIAIGEIVEGPGDVVLA
jgi:phosphoribosylformylglycinamidine cyclo-ligase